MAQEIRKISGYPVLEEGLLEDLVNTEFQPFLEVRIKKFPFGLPTDFNLLTTKQKQFLYDFGGAQTLLFLGEIPAIYKSADDKIDETIRKWMQCGINTYDIVHAPRDKYAVECAKKLASRLFKNIDDAVVIIVLGIGHRENLSKICEQEAIEYQLVDTVYPPDFITQVQAALFTPKTQSAIPKESVRPRLKTRRV